MIHFRDAKLEDAERLTEIACAAKAYWGYSEEWLQRWKPDLTITHAVIQQRKITVAIDGDTSIGFSGIEVENDSTVELTDLWVWPKFIGKGLGKQLLILACLKAKQLGFSELKIVSDPHARAFYERMGAEHISWIDSTPTGRRLPVLSMPFSANCSGTTD